MIIRENFDQRLRYFLNKYGNDGYLSATYFDYVLFDSNDNDCDYTTWENQDIVIGRISERTSETAISNAIFKFIQDDLWKYYLLDVELSYLKDNAFITGNTLCIVVRFDWNRTEAENNYDEFSLEKLDEYADFNPNGEYSMSASYGFSVGSDTDETVRGKDLALLLGVEYIG